MSLKAIALVQGVQLPTSVGVGYPCPTNSAVIVRHVVFTNTTAGSLNLTAYVVPSGGSVGDPTTVISALAIAGHTAYTSPELSGVVLNQADTLQWFSSGTGISVNASGIQQT